MKFVGSKAMLPPFPNVAEVGCNIRRAFTGEGIGGVSVEKKPEMGNEWMKFISQKYKVEKKDWQQEWLYIGENSKSLLAIG